MESPFEILGIDPDADDEAITRAYRERVKEAHPDQGGTLREFQRVRTAYESLLDGHRPLPKQVENGEATEEEPAQPDEDQITVEYLDYELLHDHGWFVGDDDLFEKAAEADLDGHDYGQFTVEAGDTLLEAAERQGLAWPFACRGGACANCAVAIVDGELEPGVDHILSSDLLDRGIRLSCLSGPATPEMQVVFNVKHMPDLQDLRLPADRFERTYPTND